jgi:hypothetical protein
VTHVDNCRRAGSDDLNKKKKVVEAIVAAGTRLFPSPAMAASSPPTYRLPQGMQTKR